MCFIIFSLYIKNEQQNSLLSKKQKDNTKHSQYFSDNKERLREQARNKYR